MVASSYQTIIWIISIKVISMIKVCGCTWEPCELSTSDVTRTRSTYRACVQELIISSWRHGTQSCQQILFWNKHFIPDVVKGYIKMGMGGGFVHHSGSTFGDKIAVLFRFCQRFRARSWMKLSISIYCFHYYSLSFKEKINQTNGYILNVLLFSF